MTKITSIRVVKCNDPNSWYSEFVGELFSYDGFMKYRNMHGGKELDFKTREPDGFINFIKASDCKLVCTCV